METDLLRLQEALDGIILDVHDMTCNGLSFFCHRNKLLSLPEGKATASFKGFVMHIQKYAHVKRQLETHASKWPRSLLASREI